MTFPGWQILLSLNNWELVFNSVTHANENFATNHFGSFEKVLDSTTQALHKYLKFQNLLPVDIVKEFPEQDPFVL